MTTKRIEGFKIARTWAIPRRTERAVMLDGHSATNVWGRIRVMWMRRVRTDHCLDGSDHHLESSGAILVLGHGL